jgi:protein-arginine kinase activator protein McsA
LHARDYCAECYDAFGETLLTINEKVKKQLNNKDKSLNCFFGPKIDENKAE